MSGVINIKTFIASFSLALQPLEWYSREEIRSMALFLLQEVAGVPAYKVLVDPEMPLEEGMVHRLQKIQQELATGRPLQYVLGYAWFYGHRFCVSEGVLIPRPETEELVRLVIQECGTGWKGKQAVSHSGAMVRSDSGKRGMRILDICTGSGCIAWSLAGALPGSRVYGCDVSGTALGIARKQTVFKEMDGDVRYAPFFFSCDILVGEAAGVIEDACQVSGGEYGLDVMVSNPPYVCVEEQKQMRKNVLDFEPEMALFVPDEDPLLFYRHITAIAAGLLVPGGKLYFEINERFAPGVMGILAGCGFAHYKTIQDINGKDRFVCGIR